MRQWHTFIHVDRHLRSSGKTAEKGASLWCGMTLGPTFKKVFCGFASCVKWFAGTVLLVLSLSAWKVMYLHCLEERRPLAKKPQHQTLSTYHRKSPWLQLLQPQTFLLWRGTIPPPCKSQSQKLLLGLGQQTSAWGLCHLGGRQHRATNLCLLRGHSHSLTAPAAIAYLRTLSRNLLIIVSITFMLT